ncbi:hypothetical protein [Kitasatospora sp. NPDC058046]|uniref:hypothetical protein n=1 Tax=Kitasatospora sp. NPDC058046 TaxID=3346312 RepID=UPI0036DF99DF
MCATCDGCVCVQCGRVEVANILELCGQCEFGSDIDEEPDAPGDGKIDTGPESGLRMRLDTAVNQLVAATGTTHRDVNARINRIIGVRTRVGADEWVIRRAAWVARGWLDRLLSNSRTDTAAPSGVPGSDGRTTSTQPAEHAARGDGAARAGGRVAWSAPPAGPVDGPEPTEGVRLVGHSDGGLRLGARTQQHPIGEAAAGCIGNGTHRDVNEVPYNDRDTYTAALGSLAGHLALIVRDLDALPPEAAAHVIAQAAAQQHGPLPEEWHRHVVGQLTEMWTGRATAFGTRPNGSFGPFRNTRVQVMVTPAQWDALARIGAPHGIAQGAQEALAAGITALDDR